MIEAFKRIDDQRDGNPVNVLGSSLPANSRSISDAMALTAGATPHED
jgi:hypothetical protein